MQLPQTLLSMNVWTGWRVRRPAAAARRSRKPLVLHPLGIDDLALSELQPLVDRLVAELGLDVRLGQHGGHIVLADEHWLRAVSPQLIEAFCEQRPIVTLAREPARGGASRGAIAYAALREQLAAMAPCRREAGTSSLPAAGMNAQGSSSRPHGRPDFGDSGSEFAPSLELQVAGTSLGHAPASDASRQFVQALLHGRTDPERKPLVASYGGALMVIDFTQMHVLLQPRALSELRLARQLPVLDLEAQPKVGMLSREFDRVLWDLGWAAGGHALHGASTDWWHQPLLAVQPQAVSRYSAVPLHLEMARALARGPMSPSQLRRECRADLAELRCFLQSCLFLGLLRWQAPDSERRP